MRLSVAGYAAPLGSSPQGMTWSLQVPRVYIGPSRWRSYRNSKSVTGHISRRAAETLVPYTVGLRPSHAALMGARTGILLPSTALFPVTQGDIPARIPNVAKNVTVGNWLPVGLSFATFVAWAKKIIHRPTKAVNFLTTTLASRRHWPPRSSLFLTLWHNATPWTWPRMMPSSGLHGIPPRYQATSGDSI